MPPSGPGHRRHVKKSAKGPPGFANQGKGEARQSQGRQASDDLQIDQLVSNSRAIDRDQPARCALTATMPLGSAGRHAGLVVALGCLCVPGFWARGAARAALRRRSCAGHQEGLCGHLEIALPPSGGALPAQQADHSARVRSRCGQSRRLLRRGRFREGAHQHRLDEHLPQEFHQELRFGILLPEQELFLRDRSAIGSLPAEPLTGRLDAAAAVAALPALPIQQAEKFHRRRETGAPVAPVARSGGSH